MKIGYSESIIDTGEPDYTPTHIELKVYEIGGEYELVREISVGTSREQIQSTLREMEAEIQNPRKSESSVVEQTIGVLRGEDV